MSNATKSRTEMEAELAAALALVKSLKSEMGRSLSIKKTDKGGVSVYGLQRFPVTLYPNQWKKLIEASQQLIEFIEKNCPENKEAV